MKINFLSRAALLGAVYSLAAAQPALPPISNLILGGADRHCSSFNGADASHGCTADWAVILAQDPAFVGRTLQDTVFDVAPPATPYRYSLNAMTRQRLREVPAPLFDAQRRAAVLALLQTLPEQAHVPFEQLDANGQLTRGLLRPEIAMLRAALLDDLPQSPRKREARSIVFASNPHVRTAYEAFVDAARAANGGRRPTIGVITASAGTHPFADADINGDALRSAGADVVYLPLDGGMRQALDRHDCAHVDLYYEAYANIRVQQSFFHATRAYPDLAAQQRSFCDNDGALLNATLGTLNGLYLSGGNQARHLESFIGKDAHGGYTRISPQLRILRARFAAGQLVVAGTSAGNHVQGGGFWRGKPVPMLGGGDSYEALRSGFVPATGPRLDGPPSDDDEGKFDPSQFARGGLGFFRFGVLDSHFSVRTREARLVRLTQQSGMDYGFGIDENTALRVHRADAQGATWMSVSGAGGVFVVDLRRAKASGARKVGRYAVDGVRAHYLLPGDLARIDAGGALTVQLDAARPLLPLRAQAPTARQDGLLDYGSAHFLRLAQAMGVSGAAIGFGSTENSRDSRTPQQDRPLYSATLARGAGTEFRGNAERLSYTQLLLKFEPCGTSCTPP